MHFPFVSYFQNEFSFEEFYLTKALRQIGTSYNKTFEVSDYIEDLKVTISILIEVKWEGDLVCS